jgi:hypothetical protein
LRLAWWWLTVCCAASASCLLARARTLPLVARDVDVRLERDGCAATSVELALPVGPARYDARAGVALDGLEGIEPAWPPAAPSGFAFLPRLRADSVRDCHDAGVTLPSAVWRARPVSVAQLEAGRLNLESEGTAPVVRGQVHWRWRLAFQAPDSTAVAAPVLPTWDHCETVRPFGVEEVSTLTGPGTVPLDSKGCQTLTRVDEGSTQRFARTKVFGTRLSYDARAGQTRSSPDVRTVEETVQKPEHRFSWQDEDGDGRRELERETWHPADGGYRDVQTVWDGNGAPAQRTISEGPTPQQVHVWQQVQADGGWVTVDDYDSTRRHFPVDPAR